jgi:hypothetical protein
MHTIKTIALVSLVLAGEAAGSEYVSDNKLLFQVDWTASEPLVPLNNSQRFRILEGKLSLSTDHFLAGTYTDPTRLRMENEFLDMHASWEPTDLSSYYEYAAEIRVDVEDLVMANPTTLGVINVEEKAWDCTPTLCTHTSTTLTPIPLEFPIDYSYELRYGPNGFPSAYVTLNVDTTILHHAAASGLDHYFRITSLNDPTLLKIFQLDGDLCGSNPIVCNAPEGRINERDFEQIRQNFLKHTVDPITGDPILECDRFGRNCVPIKGDVTGDGLIDLADFRYWKVRNQARIAGMADGLSASSVPEPSTILLLMAILPFSEASRRQILQPVRQRSGWRASPTAVLCRRYVLQNGSARPARAV